MSTLDELRAELKRLSYKPNVRMELLALAGLSDMLLLGVTRIEPESRNPDGPLCKIGFHYTLPPASMMNRDNFAREVMYALFEMERHEAREWFKRDGEIFDDPHA